MMFPVGYEVSNHLSEKNFLCYIYYCLSFFFDIDTITHIFNLYHVTQN